MKALLTRWVCDWFHGGGHIKRDPAGNINWQCALCGAWADPVNERGEQMNKRINEIQQSARIIDAIADNLIEDHVDLMLENAALQNKVDLIKASLIASLIERLDEYHPPEHAPQPFAQGERND